MFVIIMSSMSIFIFFLEFDTEDLWSEHFIYCEVTKLYLTILKSVEPIHCHFVTPEPISEISTHQSDVRNNHINST